MKNEMGRHVACMERRYRVLVGKSEEKRLLGKHGLD
jgi:hypothetical protein